ncbi:hypothetical protein [Deinococcus arcticus]|uniref:Uncharacterized protein n=1 Tax=Deinococcus arcticus TaxID=2136176 RepID=A0A2T3W6P8_9DEIO|nr:hypothetical protein [Deinococcus arcticus]PTA67454.1 hypothetical protein C8263_12870 [Deinococcus arcticus]
MLTLAELARGSAAPPDAASETQTLAAQGVPGLIVPAGFEEAFYRGGNLPEQLRRLFAPIRPARIDEDALEPLAEQAQALIRTTYLMDDAVQDFYRALARAGLPQTVTVRRPGGATGEPAVWAPPGTAALQALKRLWARDWAFEAVLARLDTAGSVALEARPTLLLPT